MKEISIITVNFNGFSITCELIDSLQKVGFEGQIIVVDNGSETDEAMLLHQHYPYITTIRSEQNLGFAGGNNLGIEKAIYPYLFFINNDTTVTFDCWSPLVERMKSDTKIGMVCPKIYYEYAPDTLQFAGYTPLHPITQRNHMIGYQQKDVGQFENALPIPYAMGAAMLTSKIVVEKAGMMPECYFLYYEELDWSERIKDAGYEVWFEPKSSIYHKESMATGRVSPLKQYYLTRNRILFAKRNLKSIYRILSILYQLFLAVPKNGFMSLKDRRLDMVWATMKGASDGCIGKVGKMK